MRRSLVPMAVLVVALAACGGDEEAPPSTTGTTGAATGATGGTGGGCVDLTSGDVFTITISDFAFDPDCLTARAAQSIAIVNEDAAEHTFTIDETMVDVSIPAGDTFNGEPVSGVLEPGTYDFHCTIHPSMSGTITVE